MSLSLFAQHGQKVQLKANSRYDYDKHRMTYEIAVIMTNFPDNNLFMKKLELGTTWGLFTEDGILSAAQQGTEFVIFAITEIEGNYYLRNEYSIWTAENGDTLEHPYKYTIRVPIIITTEEDIYKNKQKTIICDKCDGEGYLQIEWKKLPRYIGKLKNISLHNGILECVVPDDDNYVVSVRDMETLRTRKVVPSASEQGIIKLNVSDLITPMMYQITAIKMNSDYYEKLIYLQRKENGTLFFEDVWD